MLGLMYLGAALLYLTLLVVVVRWAWRQGRQDGGPVWKGAALAFLGFLLVYLPVFWNQIPVALSFKSACESDAGFIAFDDPEDWIASHRKAIQELHGIDPEKTSKSQKTSSGASRYTYMGGLLAKEDSFAERDVLGISLGRLESLIVDTGTGQVLGRVVDYSLGSREDARIWLTRRSCFSDDRHPLSQMSKFNQQLKGALK